MVLASRLAEPYRALFRRRLRGSFLAADPFWVEYFDATMAGLTKAELASRVLLANEFLQAARAPTFSGMGHSAAIVHPEAYLAVVRRFLTGGSA